MSVNSIPAMPVSRPLTASALLLVILICTSWGFNQIGVKIALAEVPPFMQAAIRSIIGLVIILGIARIRGVKLFERDGTLWTGILLGVAFGVEFIMIFHGLTLTTATRAVVFLYTAPFFVALGAYRFLGERMSRVQWFGLGLSFVGVMLAIGVPQADVDASVMFGDLLMVGGASLWALTTMVIKASNLRFVSPEKGLGYQTAVSIPMLVGASMLAGEAIPTALSPLTVGILAYQSVWVAGLTFLIWFTLVKTYSASKLSAFTFMTPLIGVIAGYLILGDQINPVFGLAALFVIAGLYLVNRPAPVA